MAVFDVKFKFAKQELKFNKLKIGETQSDFISIEKLIRINI